MLDSMFSYNGVYNPLPSLTYALAIIAQLFHELGTVTSYTFQNHQRALEKTN